MKSKKLCIISVINDLNSDQRVNRTCTTLINQGYDVFLIGRKRKNSLPITKRPYNTIRMNLIFEKGPFFYIEYNIRLFIFLLFKPCDLLFSNDLDTLLPNYLISKLYSCNIIYDSHEYFTGVPELKNRPFIRSIWKKIEKNILPNLKNIITVNKSIADLYSKEYNIDVKVIKNVPITKNNKETYSKESIGLPTDKEYIIMQGAGINIDRGYEETINAFKPEYGIKDIMLLIIGSGDVFNDLKVLIDKHKISDRVMLHPRVSFEKLYQYTKHASLGLTVDKPTNINYKFILPNKLFDYIHSGIPVLVSKTPEVVNIVEKYKIGDFINSHNPQDIADKIIEMMSNKKILKEYSKNTLKAKNELNWEIEELELIDIINNFSKK